MTKATTQTLRTSLDKNTATRIAYESEKKASSAAAKVARYFAFNFKTSASEKTDVFFDAALKCNVASFDFINNHVRENQRFNVYALEKVAKALRAVSANSATMIDKYTRAILSTVLHLREKKTDLSRADLYALMCRDLETQLKRSDQKSDVRVSANTATTQVSSSLRALAALNVLRFDNDLKRVSDVNFDHAIVALISAKK